MTRRLAWQVDEEFAKRLRKQIADLEALRESQSITEGNGEMGGDGGGGGGIE